MTAEQYFGDWMQVLDKNLLNIYRKWLFKLWLDDTEFEPDICCVFKAFRLCPMDTCKVVIIGQDPYPQHGVATGLAFANNLKKGEAPSPSLKVLENSVLSSLSEQERGLAVFDYSLESWERQGILLLNSALTVHTGKPGSHQQYWRKFLTSFIENFSQKNPDIFWILLGTEARQVKGYIKSQHGNVVTEYHPAYYARNNASMKDWIWDIMQDYIKAHYGMNLSLYNSL